MSPLLKFLEKKIKQMIMVGYCAGGYKLWDEENRKIVAAQFFTFDEKTHKKEV